MSRQPACSRSVTTGYSERLKIYGIALAAPPEVMYPAVAARARAVSEILQQATLDRLRALGVQLVYGAARLEDGHT